MMVLALACACSSSRSDDDAPLFGAGASAPAPAGGDSAPPDPSAEGESGAGAGEPGGGEASGAGLAGAPLDGANSAEAPPSEAGQDATSAEAPLAPAAGASPFPSGVTRPRILIVGDSISAGPGCYKKYLLSNLTQNGYSSFEFVGQYPDDCGGGVMHGAVSCSTAEQYTLPMFTMPNCAQGMSFPGMSTLVSTHQPDLVMMQLGVNDVWNNRPIDAILANYTTLVEQARAQNPNVVVVAAQIAQMNPNRTEGDAIFQHAAALVAAVPAWAQSVALPESPVFVADLWTNSGWADADTTDGVHPTEAGAERMGLNWFNALKGVLPPG